MAIMPITTDMPQGQDLDPGAPHPSMHAAHAEWEASHRIIDDLPRVWDELVVLLPERPVARPRRAESVNLLQQTSFSVPMPSVPSSRSLSMHTS